MNNVRDILKGKGDDVWSITPQTSMLDALNLMADKNIGALVILDNGKLVGIISERDFARSIAKAGRCPIDEPVEGYMTKEVFTVTPDMSSEECMARFTDKRIRHLPVLVGDKLVGVISIGDVVREMISTKESTIHMLSNYIEGTEYQR
jgi:CBS domain-containing protein